MSTIIKIVREDLEELQDAYGKIACVQPKEDESKSHINRIAYAAGKNYNRLRSLAMLTVENQIRIQDSFKDTEFAAFGRRHVEVCETFCKREEDGSPMITHFEDGSPSKYDIPKAMRTECDNALKELNEEFAGAIARKNANVEEAEAVLKEEIDVEIYTVTLPVDDPFSGLPQGASGSYIDICKAMFVNLPDSDE